MLGGVLKLSAGVAGGEWVFPLFQTCSPGRSVFRPGPLLPLMPLGAHTGYFLQYSQQLVSAQLYISPRIQGAGFAPPFCRRSS